MDIEISFSQTGEGFPLVLLHGNGESREYFRRQIEPFSAQYTVIAPDTRGHGQTPRGSAPFTLAQFAEDLKCLLDSLGIARANILGFSDGGNVALLFALKYPQYVEKLIIDGADLSPKGVRAKYQIPIELGYFAVCIVAIFDKKAVAKKEMLGLMVTQPDIKPAELTRLTMPTLVIAGDNDMIKRSHTQAIAAAIPNSELRILEGDHFLAGRRSTCAAFNAAVLDFLRR